MRIVKAVTIIGLSMAVGAAIWRLVIPRLPRSKQADDGASSTLGTMSGDTEASRPSDATKKNGPSVSGKNPRSESGEATEQVSAELGGEVSAELGDTARDEVGIDWHAALERVRASCRRLLHSWRIADRMPRALWIALGILFVLVGAFSAHASWREYDGLMTGFVILVVFSSVSAALARDLVAGTRYQISQDPALLLTDDALRLLTLTVVGVLFTAVYPMFPAVRPLVAFFAGGALAAAAASVLVLLARSVDVRSVVSLDDE